jgi:hypothetical protein
MFSVYDIVPLGILKKLPLSVKLSPGEDPTTLSLTLFGMDEESRPSAARANVPDCGPLTGIGFFE